MTLRYAGQYNGYLPRETGQVVQFVRNEAKFPLREYVQFVPTDVSLGTYTVMERDAFVRVTNSGEDNAWHDGDERPNMQYNKVRFEVQDFRTLRKDFGWVVGYKTMEQTTLFQLKPIHMALATSQAMTELTYRVCTALQTASNWGGNSLDVNALNGGKGKWTDGSDDPNSPNYNAIFVTLQNAAAKINLYTNANVKPTDLVVVVSPELANALAATSEITNYCRESPAAREILEKGLDPQFMLYGLPATYKGFKFVVEDSPIITSNALTAGTQSTTRTRCKDDTSAFIVSRPGGLDGEYGAPSFSTVQVFHYGAITQVEAFDDPKNKRVEGHVVTDTAVEISAAIAGFHVTGVF